MPSSVFSHTWGGRDRGTKDISSDGARFREYGSSGESQMKDNIYNDKESGDIFARDGTYLGSINMEEGLKNPELKALHTKYKKDPNNEFNSHNDIAGAIQKAYAAGEFEAPKENTNPTFNEAEFSPQIQEAIERSNKYREDNWSGKTAQDIYGKSNDLAKGAYGGRFDHGVDNKGYQAADIATDNYFNSDKYALDLKNKQAQNEAAQA